MFTTFLLVQSIMKTPLLLLLYLFPLLCGVDVSYETPPSRPVLRVLLWQTPLRQVVPDAIQPPPLWSSSPSFPRHLHHHHSLPYAFVFSSRNMPIPLQPTLLHFLGYFSHFCRPSNYFIPNSVNNEDWFARKWQIRAVYNVSQHYINDAWIYASMQHTHAFIWKTWPWGKLLQKSWGMLIQYGTWNKCIPEQH